MVQEKQNTKEKSKKGKYLYMFNMYLYYTLCIYKIFIYVYIYLLFRFFCILFCDIHVCISQISFSWIVKIWSETDSAIYISLEVKNSVFLHFCLTLMFDQYAQTANLEKVPRKSTLWEKGLTFEPQENLSFYVDSATWEQDNFEQGM